MSKSVADVMAYFGDPDTAETEIFIRTIDRFFIASVHPNGPTRRNLI